MNRTDGEGLTAARHFVRYRAFFLRRQPRRGPIPHPTLDGLLYRAYPWELSAPDGRRDYGLRGCLGEFWGWVTDVDPQNPQATILDLAEEDGGGFLLLDKAVIRRPPSEVYAAITWAPWHPEEMYSSIGNLSVAGSVDKHAQQRAKTWLTVALELPPFGRPKGSSELNTPTRMADATRQAMVTRMRKGAPVTRALIAEDLHLSHSRFTARLEELKKDGPSWPLLLSQALTRVPHTTSRVQRPHKIYC
jgi:hypothetical protein